ncbi:hypothetical protein Scep_021653 [Stephania cephalantha]|uniref:Uncharacterized protein n=1 Tax=Stephania cephalantha TaxID=152367 RepID=A0AAP0F4Q8_9MAGN
MALSGSEANEEHKKWKSSKTSVIVATRERESFPTVCDLLTIANSILFTKQLRIRSSSPSNCLFDKAVPYFLYSLSILFTKPCPTRTPLLSDPSSSSRLYFVVVLAPLLRRLPHASAVILAPLLRRLPHASAPWSSKRLCSVVVLALAPLLPSRPRTPLLPGRAALLWSSSRCSAPVVLFFSPRLCSSRLSHRALIQSPLRPLCSLIVLSFSPRLAVFHW